MGKGQRILFPLDMDDGTEVLLPATRELRKIGVKEIYLLHVIHPVDVLAVPNIVSHRTEIMRRYRESLLQNGFTLVQGEVVVGTPWVEIANRAKSPDIMFILMGSQGKGLLKRVFLGSQTENVLYHTDRTLFILRMSMTGDRFTLSDEDLFGKILYATDLSKGSQKCIPFLDGLAPTRASLTIAHVEDIRHLEYASMETLRALRGRAEKEVAGLKEHFMQAGFEQVEMVFRRGNAIGELLNLIEQESPSLLVIGATGTYSIAERALGGVAETLIHRAPVHVLLVR